MCITQCAPYPILSRVCPVQGFSCQGFVVSRVCLSKVCWCIMYYIALESDCFEASACAGAASFSLLERAAVPVRRNCMNKWRRRQWKRCGSCNSSLGSHSVLHLGGGGGELRGRELSPVPQSCADVGQQGAQKKGVKQNVSICGDEGPHLRVVCGDVAVSQRRCIK
jgi:hypothetical protein